MGLEDFFEDSMGINEFNLLLEKKCFENYVQVCEAIKDMTKDLKARELKIVLYYPADELTFSTQHFSYKNLCAVRIISMLYLLGKDHSKNKLTGRERAFNFVLTSVEKAGIKLNGVKPIRQWIRVVYNNEKYFTKIDERKSLVKIISPVLYETKFKSESFFAKR